jgi:hypothetical protein
MISKISIVIFGFAAGQSMPPNPTKDDCLQNEWGLKQDGFDEKFRAFADTCAQVLFDSNEDVAEGNTSMEFVSHVSDGEGIKGDNGQPLTGPKVADEDKCLWDILRQIVMRLVEPMLAQSSTTVMLRVRNTIPTSS